MINLFDSKGQIALDVISEAEVAAITEPQQLRLSELIAAVQARESASARFLAAQRGAFDCQREHDEALAAHATANPPPDRIAALRSAQEAYRNSHS